VLPPKHQLGQAGVGVSTLTTVAPHCPGRPAEMSRIGKSEEGALLQTTSTTLSESMETDDEGSPKPRKRGSVIGMAVNSLVQITRRRSRSDTGAANSGPDIEAFRTGLCRAPPFRFMDMLSAQTLMAFSNDHVASAFRLLTHPDLGVSVRDRKYHLRTYKACFVGREAVDCLMAHYSVVVNTREEAVCLGQQLVKMGLIEHVTTDHVFKDDFLFFRFCEPDTDCIGPCHMRLFNARVMMRCMMALQAPVAGVEVKARSYLLKSHPDCFIGSEAVTVMLQALPEDLRTRSCAVFVGNLLMDAGMIEHVTAERRFKDTNFFYRFNKDKKNLPFSTFADLDFKEEMQRVWTLPFSTLKADFMRLHKAVTLKVHGSVVQTEDTGEAEPLFEALMDAVNEPDKDACRTFFKELIDWSLHPECHFKTLSYMRLFSQGLVANPAITLRFYCTERYQIKDSKRPDSWTVTLNMLDQAGSAEVEHVRWEDGRAGDFSVRWRLYVRVGAAPSGSACDCKEEGGRSTTPDLVVTDVNVRVEEIQFKDDAVPFRRQELAFLLHDLMGE